MDNFSTLTLAAKSENIAVARLWVTAFCGKLPFSLSEVEEIKVAVSEGVSNAMIHGYQNDETKTVVMDLSVEENTVVISITDKGCGIGDIKKAMTPMVSSQEEHMGLGFVFMQSFMDELGVESTLGEGTRLTMKRTASS